MSAAGLSTAASWQHAVEEALAALAPESAPPDLAVVFVSPHFQAEMEAITTVINARLKPGTIIGCTGQGIIGPGRELESVSAVAIAVFDLPGATIRAGHISLQDFARLPETPENWQRALGIAPADVNAWLILGDPFTFDVEMLIRGIESAYPGTVVAGGMASSAALQRGTRLINGPMVHDEGAVVVAIGGGWTLHPLVSQGAEPVGETWTVTAAEGNHLQAIGGRPAIEVLRDMLLAMDEDRRVRVSQNLLLGIAMNEYADEFGRGDFLIRNLHGFDRVTGAIVVGDTPRVGQTVQFQFRDAGAADEELHAMLAEALDDMQEEPPAGALLFSCNGRGQGLFGPVDHDPAAVMAHFGALPIAGFFCNGEIGPVGGKTFLHGFTASIAFFVPKTE
jgi:small ligand-binding sensory domain FIST